MGNHEDAADSYRLCRKCGGNGMLSPAQADYSVAVAIRLPVCHAVMQVTPDVV